MSYAIVILTIGFLILIHELGHFVMARRMGIPVSRFSIGYGPKLWSFRHGETEYRLSVVPLGGYVLPDIKSEDELYQIPIHKRIVFTSGGIVANILLVILLLAVLNTVVSGFSLSGIFVNPFVQTWRQFSQMAMAIPSIFSHPDEMSGIVGIVAQGSGFIGMNPIRIISFAILISLNLAIFNLLPFPPLDGGKLLLYALERINPRFTKLQLPLAIAGFILLIGLMVYVTAMDVGRIFGGVGA